MTVDTTGANLPATQADVTYETGLEDFDVATEGSIPRLSIKHGDVSMWKLNIQEDPFPVFRGIILGLVKQRVLWPAVYQGDDSDPLCKSVNNNDGLVVWEAFPWEASGFNPSDPATARFDEQGNIILPCAGCRLKEWNSHPTGKQPWCNQQATLPMLIDLGDDPNEPQWMPAVASFSKTALRPINNHITPYAARQEPMYVDIVEFSLKAATSNGRRYGVPTIRTVGKTDRSEWAAYSVQYKQMRSFLTAAPNQKEEEEPGAVPPPPPPPAAPVTIAAPVAPSVAPPPPPVASPSVPAPPSAPVAASPVPSAPSAPVAEPAPTAPAEPVAPAPAPTSAPQAPAPPAPAPQTAPAAAPPAPASPPAPVRPTAAAPASPPAPPAAPSSAPVAPPAPPVAPSSAPAMPGAPADGSDLPF